MAYAFHLSQFRLRAFPVSVSSSSEKRQKTLFCAGKHTTSWQARENMELVGKRGKTRVSQIMVFACF